VANAQVTKEEQSTLTPDKVLTDLMAGNARFAAVGLFLKTTTLGGPIDAFAACAHSPPDSKAAGIIRDAEFKVAFFVRLTSSRPK
jgi:hypothetical protein